MKKKLLAGITTGLFMFGLFGLAEAVPILEASYVNNTFIIDGNLDEDAWLSSQKYTETFESGSTYVEASIYLAHDNNYFYVGLETPFSNGWDSLSNVMIDGDHDHVMSSQPSSPFYDVIGTRAAPGGYPPYNGYRTFNNNGSTKVTPPAGYASASSGTPVSYEYKFVISDFTDSINNTIGINFMIQSIANKDNQYYFPVSEIMKTANPDWMAPFADVGAWADLSFESSAPVPEPATMLLLSTGLVGLAGTKIRRKMKK